MVFFSQVVLSLINTLQASFSAYNLYLASISINNLLGYQDASKKAAEYSNIAEKQLHKTRTTQASGTLAVVLSFITSAPLMFHPFFSSHPLSKTTGFGLVSLNIAVLMAARAHVGEFWKSKAKVPLPGVGDYNEAIGKTKEIRLNMAYLAASWVLCGGVVLAL